MKLIALKDFSPDGVLKLKAGDKFEMSDKSGRFLIATNRAKFDPEDEDEEQSKSGKYKRRDMRAEK